MIQNPLIINNGFDEKNFNIVKKRLIDDLNSLKGNNHFLSLHKTLKLISDDPSINYHMYDVLDFINNITKEDLLKYLISGICNSNFFQNEFFDNLVQNIENFKIENYLLNSIENEYELKQLLPKINDKTIFEKPDL